MKDGRIHIRLSVEDKVKFNTICNQLACTYTEFLESKINDEIDYGSKKAIFDFIRKDDYFYGKVDNNINQIAKKVNAEKNISEDLLREHNKLLAQLYQLSQEKVRVISEIYKALVK